MMLGKLSGAPLPHDHPYAPAIESACLDVMSPALAYAIAYHESIQGEINEKWTAATVVSGDGGHGLFQLTSSYPSNWEDPAANARYAVAHFLEPAHDFWTQYYRLEGTDLVRAIAAEFNAGRSNALAGHHAGNIDLYTTDHYATAVLHLYSQFAGAAAAQQLAERTPPDHDHDHDG